MFFLLLCVSGVLSFNTYEGSQPKPPPPTYNSQHAHNYGIQAGQSNFRPDNTHNYGYQAEQNSFRPDNTHNYGSQLGPNGFQSHSTQNYGSQYVLSSSQPQKAHNYGSQNSQSSLQTDSNHNYGSQAGQAGQTYQHEYSWQSKWQHKYEWSKPATSGQSYGGTTYEIIPSSVPNKDTVPVITDQTGTVYYPPGVMAPMPVYSPGPVKPGKNYSTTPRPPPQSQPTGGPQPGTLSQPVPTLGELYAPSLQWHVGIYTKRFTPYMQVCGGSLVKSDVVLSAAHCFWNDDVGALRPGLFAVAAGKLLRPWETEGELYTQHSEIRDIQIPLRFQGGKTSFQDDLAVVLLSGALDYAPGVKPICVSFDLNREQGLLTSGNVGTIAGWGLTTPNGPPSQRLNFLKLPYVDIQECIRTADPSFLKYITSDKICAGDQRTGRALCRGDSGGGLAYYAGLVPYLVGVASTAQRDGNECNAYAVATFTHVLAHRTFLQEHVPGIGEGCEALYEHRTEAQNGTAVSPTVTQTIQEQDKDQIPQLGVGLPNTITERTSLTNTNGQEEIIPKDVTTTQSGDPEMAKDPSNASSHPNRGAEVTKDPGNTANTASEGPEVTKDTCKASSHIDEGPEVTKDPGKPTSHTNRGHEVTKNPDATIGGQVTPTWDVTSEKEVTTCSMNVGRGERGVARVPVGTAGTFVCNCYCKN